jgi:hypothetical protein
MTHAFFDKDAVVEERRLPRAFQEAAAREEGLMGRPSRSGMESHASQSEAWKWRSRTC